MAERFLILGAGSFYGSNFARLVAEKGDESYALTRAQFNLNTLASGKPAKWDFSGYDYIVNFISRSLVVESWDNPVWWYTTNTLATAELFRQVLGQKFKKFIHVSTPEVYGNTPAWVDEDAPFNPSTPYAVSRAAADMAAMAYHRAYGFPVIITRTANIYGAGQGPNRFIPIAFDKLAHGEPLTLHGVGETVRSWIHVRDACEATYLLCKAGSIGKTYHISTAESHMVKEVASIIAGIIGLPDASLVKHGPDRLGKDIAYLLKSDRLRALGWRETIPLYEGLKGLWEKK